MTMELMEQQPFLERLAQGVAALFGPNCEVAVHDLTQGYESTIVAIENGHVTGRRVGDSASEIVLQAIRKKTSRVEDRYSYLVRTKEGRMIKSSSIYIRNDRGELIGLFAINYDITDLIMANRAIEEAISVEEPEDEAKLDTIVTNVSDLLDQLIAEADKFIGKPVATMNKDDKTKAIQYLNEKGAFLIKKAGDKVTRHYDISKYTLYNYMDSDSL